MELSVEEIAKQLYEKDGFNYACLPTEEAWVKDREDVRERYRKEAMKRLPENRLHNEDQQSTVECTISYKILTLAMEHKMIPTVGRIVKYKFSAADADAIAQRRGRKSTSGNIVHAGETKPAIIVQTWGSEPHSSVNLKVFLDGDDCFWATSVCEGEEERNFQWPEISRG